MNHANQDFIRPGFETRPLPDFPDALSDWSRQEAEALARTEGLIPTEEHWRAVRTLQALYARHDEPSVSVRQLHDALNEEFRAQGGIKHLYILFPQGPVAQGCLLAGLQPPSGTQDKGFGSAV